MTTYTIIFSGLDSDGFAKVTELADTLNYNYVYVGLRLYVRNVVYEDYKIFVQLAEELGGTTNTETVQGETGYILQSVYNPYNFLWGDWRLLSTLFYVIYNGGGGTVGGITGTEYLTVYGPMTGEQVKQFTQLAQELGVAIVQTGEDERWNLQIGPMTSDQKVQFQKLADNLNIKYDNNPSGNIPPVINPGEDIKFTRQQFIEIIGDYMSYKGKLEGWYPSVAIAQAILESGNGNSGLTAVSNNLYGYKWYGYGDYVEYPTKEWDPIKGEYYDAVAKFKAYPNWNASIDDYFVLIGKDYYKPARNAGTYQEACQKLQDLGYATSPTYASTLIDIIVANNLTRYD